MINLLEHENALWVFPLSVALQRDVRQVALDFNSGSIDKAKLPAVKKGFVHSLNAVIDSGFDFYYVKPSQHNNTLSPMAQKTVDSIVATVRGAIHLVVQRLFKKMSHKDLQSTAYYLDSMIVEKPDAKSDDYRYYLVFPLDETVRVKFAEVLKAIEESQTVESYASELIEVFKEIVSEAVRYYYYLPTEYIGVSGFAKKAADLGMDTTVKGIQRIIRRVIKEVSHKEVVLFADSLPHFVFTADVPYAVCAPKFAEGK